VRVGQLGAQEEREGVAVLALLVGELDDQVAALALDLLVEHGVEQRVDLLLDVLDHQRRAKGHGVLQVVAEALFDELRILDRVLGLARVDPAQALRLRVDHERPLLRARHHDAVLDGEVVRGQPLERPVADGRLVDEEERDVEVLGAGHALGEAVRREELVGELLAVLGIVGPHVRDEGARERHVARQPLDLVREGRALQLPARALAREAADEAVGGVHLLLARLGIVLHRLFRCHRLVELALHLVELGRDLVELGLRLGELRVGRLELALGNLQPLHLGLDHLGDADVQCHRLGPRAQARKRRGDLARRVGIHVLAGEVGVEQLDGLVVDRVLVEVLERRQEADVCHHRQRKVP
jgi:hypothetical protein